MKPTYLAMNFAPSVDLIRPIRLFVAPFFQHLLGRGSASERLELATQELLENSMKFCKDGETRLRVAVSPLTAGAIISVNTRNTATPENIRRLERAVQSLSGTNPQAVYMELLAASEDDGAGVGLARIRVEADMELTCIVTDDDVDVRAQGRIEKLDGNADPS